MRRVLRWVGLVAGVLSCSGSEVGVSLDGVAEEPEIFLSVGLTLGGKESATVEVLVGEDSVAASLRFVYYVRKTNPDIDFASRIADIVEEKLAGVEVTEARSAALVFQNNSALKTAGKYVRRAEEASLDDRHLSAAAGDRGSTRVL